MHRLTTAVLTAVIGLLSLGLTSTSAIAADTCPNAAIRAQQGAEHLPDCRAWEQASPVDKGGANIGLGKPPQASVDPGAVAFIMSSGIPGGPTTMAIGYFRAKRTSTGWGIGFYDPPQANPGTQRIHATRWISPDLSKSVSASDVALAPGAIPGGTSVYLHDLDAGTFTTIASLPMNAVTDATSPGSSPLATDFLDVLPGPVWAATTDMSHIVFETRADLGQGAATGERVLANVWEFADGRLRLVNVLPDGTPATNGGSLAIGAAYQFPNFINADGTRIVFTATGSLGTAGPIYVRENGTATKLVAHSQRAGDDPTAPDPGPFLVGASRDGRYVYFQSTSLLTDDAVGSGRYLYRADTATDTITLIAGTGTDSAAGAGKNVQRISEDGQRVYFTTEDRLRPTDPVGVKLYVWDHGVTRFLALTAENLWFAMTDDGRYASFSASMSPTGYDRRSSACPDGAGQPGPCAEMYSYDAITDQVSCMSCSVSGTLGGSGMGVSSVRLGQYAVTGVLDDGTFLFDTPNALVPEDTNKKRDVYAWKDGQPRLISSGVDINDALFAGASDDGTDVYFGTLSRLVAQDNDSLRDIYTARIDGGLAGQNVVAEPPAECALEACQGTPLAPQSPPTAGSLTFSGAGNVMSEAVVPARRVRVSKVKTITGSAATLRVTVPAAGMIAVSGTGLRSAKRTAAKAATYTVSVSLSTKAKAILKRRGSLKVRTTVAFTPTGGKRTSSALTLTFKRPKAR